MLQRCSPNPDQSCAMEVCIFVLSSSNVYATTIRSDEIYIDVGFDNKIHYQNDFPILTNSSQINGLNIRLYDEWMDPLQTNNNYDMKLLCNGE